MAFYLLKWGLRSLFFFSGKNSLNAGTEENLKTILRESRTLMKSKSLFPESPCLMGGSRGQVDPGPAGGSGFGLDWAVIPRGSVLRMWEVGAGDRHSALGSQKAGFLSECVPLPALRCL